MSHILYLESVRIYNNTCNHEFIKLPTFVNEIYILFDYEWTAFYRNQSTGNCKHDFVQRFGGSRMCHVKELIRNGAIHFESLVMIYLLWVFFLIITKDTQYWGANKLRWQC